MSRTQLRAPSHFTDIISESVQKGVRAGVLMQRSTDSSYQGRCVEVEGAPTRNFGGCSYLGLDQRAELKDAAIDAIQRFGTQFSFSRAYLESPLYRELEDLLDQVTGGSVLVTPSTSLGHIATLPTLIEMGDAVLVDRSAHASLHTALSVLKGIPIEAIAHNDMEALEQGIVRLGKSHRHVWYVLDGIYSMLGDFAPFAQLEQLLARHPQLHLYVDDAHATSWIGKNGRGLALDLLADKQRVVVALSLNKAFSAAGGAIVFPRTELRDRVRHCGGPMLFSGPVQPPMLGAAVASAKLHLSSELATLQHTLARRIALMVDTCARAGVPLVNQAHSPIFFVRSGPLDHTFALLGALRDSGFYACAGMFPAVPHDKSGPRFTVSVHNTEQDIEEFVTALASSAARCNVRFIDALPSANSHVSDANSSAAE